MSSRPSRGAARLAAILDALPDALVLVNANGTVVNANAIALEAFEAPGTALVGRGLLDLLPEFDSRLIPGSMRRPDTTDEQGRTKPKRMIARRTDGSEFPVEVTSSHLEDSRQAYDERFGSHGGYGGYGADEMLMIVVRDLSGALNTEAELARSQRQTEMILRAAAEGVVGTDTDGRVVLVNPAAAQILGFRASDLGGQELHPLVLHSRADGEPFPYEESPLADTLRSGRKHRVRGQVLWSKSGEKVSVDLTTAPVRDGDQLVGAVMTFTDRRPYDTLAEKYEAAVARHAEELRAAAEQREEELRAAAELREEQLAAEQERYAALAEREKDRHEELAEREQTRYESLAARHSQLIAVLDQSLRGPLDELRRELAALAADDAGQLWPEANQVLHHLSAGYARMTTLVDNVLGYQRLEAGTEQLSRTPVLLDAVVAAGVDGAVELIGPGRVQFAVHAPPITVAVDARRLATALAHLIADVAGIDATGNTRAGAGAYVDSTVVVAAAQRGEVVRIEVRGPFAGGDPVHEPVVRGIVEAHGGVLQTHEVPGTNGSAFVLEVPMGEVPTGQAPAGEASAGVGSALAVGAGASSRTGAGGAGADRSSGVDTGSTETAGSGVPVPGQGPGGPGTIDSSGGPGGPGGPGGLGGPGGGRRRARRSSVDSFLDSAVPGDGDGDGESGVSGDGGSGGPDGSGQAARGAAADDSSGSSSSGSHEMTGTGSDAGPGSGGTGRRRRRAVAQGPAGTGPEAGPETLAGAGAADLSGGGADSSGGPGGASGGASGGTGRRRGRPSPAEGAVVTAAEHAAGSAALGQTVPPQGVPSQGGPSQGGPSQGGPSQGGPSQGGPSQGGPGSAEVAVASGRRARHGGEQQALALPSGTGQGSGGPEGGGAEAGGPAGGGDAPRPGGRRARRALAAARERAAAEEASNSRVFALPPADADREAGSGVPGGAEQVGVEQGPEPGDGGAYAGGAYAGQPYGGEAYAAGPAQVGAAHGRPAQVGASVNVPAGVQAGLQARTRGGVPAQGGVPEASAQVQEGGMAAYGAQAAGVRGARTAGARRGASAGAQGGVPVGAPAGAGGFAPGAAPGSLPAAVPGTVPPAGLIPAAPAAPSSPITSTGQDLPGQDDTGRHDAALHDPTRDHTPLESHPAQTSTPYGPPAPHGAGGQHGAGGPHGPASSHGPAAPHGPAPGTGAPAPGAPAQGASNGPSASSASVPRQQAPTGRRRARPAPPAEPTTPTPAQGMPAQGTPAQGTPAQGMPAAQGGPLQGGRTQGTPPSGTPAPGAPAHGTPPQAGRHAEAMPPQGTPAQGMPAQGTPAQGTPTPAHGAALPPERDPRARAAQPLPAENAPVDPNSTQGRAFSVRTLGQGVPFGRQGNAPQPGRTHQGGQAPQSPQASQPPQSPHSPHQLPQAQPQAQPQAHGQTQQAHQAQQSRQAAQAPQPPRPAQSPPPPQSQASQPAAAQAQPQASPQPPSHTPSQPSPGGSGRRRRLSTPPEPLADERQDVARPHSQPQPHPQGQPQAHSHGQRQGQPQPQQAPQQSRVQPQPRISPTTEGTGRAYAIGAPDEDADEGPQLLDGPGGAVEVANRPQPQPMDDELPPEPLDNPRRLLVWPAPDVTTQQALSDRGYRPVIVHSREEVDAQIAAFPAALFVDPLTGPITRTALQSLRQAAVAAEVPVLVTAGLGQASREAAYGADPAVLLKALAPRDSEQHPPRVLLIEEHEEIALALTATLERRGMQVARAESDADAVTLAAQMRPNLVVMDLLQVRRRRAGIIDWLRANGRLNRTPLVVYTAAVDETDLPKLAAGETVLFLAERSTSGEVQNRIVDLLAKIGTN